jgi:FeoB-associated Cys-rich membrane protein
MDDWQLPLTLLIVLGAAAYLARQVWRSCRGARSGCGGGCGCGKKAPAPGGTAVTLIPADQLTVRRRQAGPEGRETGTVPS